MNHPDPTRRRLLMASLTLPLMSTLAGCAAPLPTRKNPQTTKAAHALLMLSARAHGLDSFERIHDINVSYAGRWRPLVGRLQPALVDAGFRGGSEERLLLEPRIVAQAHVGPSGRKHVVREYGKSGDGDAQLWVNGVPTSGAEARAAAALVVDGYGLFLLGPLWLAHLAVRDAALQIEMAGSEKLHLDGQAVECDVIRLRIAPGLGFSPADELALFIERDRHLMRCVRFTLNGLESTQGAIAEVQTFDHRQLQGVLWPTRFYERLLRPLPLPVHNWQLTGLDLNRGLGIEDISGSEFSGTAVAAATPLPAAR